MARDFNQIRNTNAKLGIANVNTLGTYFALELGYDGFSKVYVEPPQAPTDIEKYLEGDSTIVTYPVASNVSNLCLYALASYPNIKTIYLFSDTMVTLADDLSYLTELESIYVPYDLLDSYKGTYTSIASKFKDIVYQYTVEIVYFSGTSTTLTEEEVYRQLAMLGSNQIAGIQKLVISDDYTFESASNIAWNYDYSAFTSLNNNIWYGENYKFDFSELTIIGTGTLTEVDIDNAIANVPSTKRTAITNVKISGYSDMSVALEYDYEDLPNLEYVWLDNVRYELVSGELINPNYFYSLTDLEQEYDATKTQTFYLDYNGTFPTLSEDYTYTWYSDINCTTTILPENMVSGNRYYVKAVMVTLVIQGSGTFTQTIFQNAINQLSKPSDITKVVIESGFTQRENNCFNPIDNLTNCTVLEIRSSFVAGSYFNSYYTTSKTDTHLQEIIYTPTTIEDGIFGYCVVPQVTAPNATNIGRYNARFTESIRYNLLSATYLGHEFSNLSNGLKYCYIGTSNCTLGSRCFGEGNSTRIYFKAEYLEDYINGTVDNRWTSWSSYMRGYFEYNGTLPTFTNYTPTFYEDEDCTIVISSGFVVGTQYYVKLTAI